MSPPAWSASGNAAKSTREGLPSSFLPWSPGTALQPLPEAAGMAISTIEQRPPRAKHGFLVVVVLGAGAVGRTHGTAQRGLAQQRNQRAGQRRVVERCYEIAVLGRQHLLDVADIGRG